MALYQNCPNLPFTNAKLAASVGLTVEDFAGLEVTKASCNVVYDALAQSSSGLIQASLIDERRSAFVTAEGAFDEAAFARALLQARLLAGSALLAKPVFFAAVFVAATSSKFA